ncbi:Retinol dehydrogenase 13 [Tieghemiomyces parasiticus]|uniref:Retinol dehydrogenase 13 n=1 Tax=Tieghemiomyces parasiticus TaxID=78921 RepID=A0A9W7ZMH2_9FUNG|nr:Retinol dehydrogenase 13 [Tieghemiomyces parasiticus]
MGDTTPSTSNVVVAQPSVVDQAQLWIGRQTALPNSWRCNLIGGLEFLSHFGEALFEGRISTRSRITRLVRMADLPAIEGGHTPNPGAGHNNDYYPRPRRSSGFGQTEEGEGTPLAPVDQTDSRRPVAIVTGANSGCGYETTKALLQAGYFVVLACRSALAAEHAMDRIVQETDLRHMTFMELDLASLESVQGFVEAYRRRGWPLHVLVNNAGIMNTPYARTADGFESQWGVNHVGHFVLTMGLLPVIKRTVSWSPSDKQGNEKRSSFARIINVSSVAHVSEPNFDPAVLEDPAKYHPLVNYGMSKLANICFTAELSRRLAADQDLQGHRRITVNACHPGPVSTGLYRYTPGLSKLGTLLDMILLSPAQGALTQIYLCLAPEVRDVSGVYFFDLEPRATSETARNVQVQKQVWDYTVRQLTDKLPQAKDWA